MGWIGKLIDVFLPAMGLVPDGPSLRDVMVKLDTIRDQVRAVRRQVLRAPLPEAQRLALADDLLAVDDALAVLRVDAIGMHCRAEMLGRMVGQGLW